MGFRAKPSTVDFKPEEANNLVGIVDTDYVKYGVAGVGEDRSIKVTHKASGKEVLNTIIEVEEVDGEEKEVEKKVRFKNRTAFWGRSKKTIGGQLGKWNEGREVPFTKEDFEIGDIQEIQNKANVLHSAKVSILNDLKASGVGSYECIIGKGKSFRVGVSTLKEYKGNRKNTLKPLLLDDVTEYLTKRFDCKTVSGIEADDYCVMRAYGDPNAVVMGVDKDYRGQPIKFYDVNNPQDGIMDCNCFGQLEWIASKSKFSGFGRIFLYCQMISEDDADNYKANAHSGTKWGAKSAYDALKDCKDDIEALNKVIEVFKMLYPEPKEIESWRENRIPITWYSVADEMFQMARMQRWPGDIMSFDQYCYDHDVKF